MEGHMTLEFEDVMAAVKDCCLVDVRTKTEFSRGSIPGSINVPLFNEDERGAIGRVYTADQKKAKYLAMDIAAPKIPDFVRSIDQLRDGKPVIVICWRGGMRSHAVAQFLFLAGLPANQLRGGYHNYRRNIYRQLRDYKLNEQLVVLAGKSGTGKTKILSLLSEQGYPVLDLEQIAGHKGSNFGDIGKVPAQSQKSFDSLILNRLNELRGRSPIYLEGESRRIGNVVLPEFLYMAMKAAPVIEIVGSLESRIARILLDYTPTTKEERISLYLALSRLKRGLAEGTHARLKMHLDRQEYRQFVQDILTGYYDQRYNQGYRRKVIMTVDSDDIGQAVKSIMHIAGIHFA